MIERKDTPAPLMQRRAPPPLDFRPKLKQTASASPSAASVSPPRTPPPFKLRARAKRAAHAHADRYTPRETYLGSQSDEAENARGGAESRMRDERISHDLSLTDNNRYSVVDNMLLSLNPDPSAPPSVNLAAPAAPRFVSPASAAPRLVSPASVNLAFPAAWRGPRRRGHTHSSSLNTAYTLPLEESSLSSSIQATHGRRSNSSNYQSSLGRIDSVHRDEDRLNQIRAKFTPTQGAYAGDKGFGAPIRKSRKSSKSSGSSSVDFGHIVGPPRWQTPGARRSSSFDRGYGRNPGPSSKRPAIESPMGHAFSQPGDDPASDAAPTPTVPVGPGRASPPAWRSKKKMQLSYNPLPGRNNQGAPLPQQSEGNRSMIVTNAPGDDFAPALAIPRNPSPSRAGPDTRPPGALLVKEPPKERPGFFRRVFGSSRTNQPWTIEAVPGRLQSSQDSVRAESRGGFVSPSKSSKFPPHEDSPQSLKENLPPALAKKPSSFFRRRKKSISSPNHLSALPVHVTGHAKSDPDQASTDQRPGSSSISSLREVMNPYLGRALTSHPQGNLGRDPTAGGYAGSISTSSLLRNESRPRSRSKLVMGAGETPLASRVGHLRQIRSPEYGMKTEKAARSTVGETPPGAHQAKTEEVLLSIQNSFYIDNSSTESKTIRSPNNAESQGMDPEILDQQLAALPADNSLGDGKDMRRTVNPSYQPNLIMPQTPMSIRKSKPLTSRSETFPPVTPTSGNVLKQSKTVDWDAKVGNPSSGDIPTAPSKSPKGARLVTEDLNETQESDRLHLPLEGIQISPVSEYHSVSSLVAPKNNEPDGILTLPDQCETGMPPCTIGEVIPTEDDRLLAKRVYDGDQDVVAKEKAAAWLGEAEHDRARLRRAFMEFFDWQNLNILASLRDLCGRLVLKGETQQVDRILEAFAWRWCVCNANHGFKATGTFPPFILRGFNVDEW